MIHIQLISADSELYRLCREILAEFPAPDWTLVQSAECQAGSSNDLHIWDYHPEMAFPDGIIPCPSRHLFLVHRPHMDGFRKIAGAADASIILQPVSRAALASYLALAVTAKKERVQTENWLRADRDEMLQCLIQANLRLQEYDQERTNFLSRALHDFRAPLTALTGYCSLMLSEPLGALSEDQKEVIRRMQHSAKRLSRMANAMFEMSVGRQVKRTPDLQAADIRACIEQATHEIMPLAERRQISISLDLATDVPPLYFEPGQIEQVLINILDNACKFTHRQGEIEIRGYPYFWERREPRGKAAFSTDRRNGPSREPNSYRIDIRDSGSPIPKEQLKGMFEEYTSYSGSRDRSGAGLGLAICAMIMRQHNGQIWAENTDRGPLFAFVLPSKWEEAEPEKKASSHRVNGRGGDVSDYEYQA
jgi:signal transduction histidine kinase